MVDVAIPEIPVVTSDWYVKEVEVPAEIVTPVENEPFAITPAVS